VRKRKYFFFISAAGFLAFYIWGLHNLPGLGHYPGPYGDVLNSLSVYERHATDVVTAVNFDYRGLDTLGEEFILFTSVMGAVLLLRKQKDEQRDDPADSAPDRVPTPTSDAVRLLGLLLVGPLVVFGLYIVTHGQLTPGGGFQGGVILATAPLLIYLCGDYQLFRKITSHTLTEATEATGAGGYALVGIVSLFLGMSYLQNFLPLGQTGNVASSGTIALISFLTGMEVTAGLVLLMMAFFEEAFALRHGKEQKEENA
jgi:multicomponent Na+:H+ antiporter subunit B